jgi:hypothetical protein
MRLHGVVFNYLVIGTALPFALPLQQKLFSSGYFCRDPNTYAGSLQAISAGT